MKLYVKNIEVGNYECLCSEWELNLKHQVYSHDEISVYQFSYYLRDFANFFALYIYEDGDKDISDLYLIDSNNISLYGDVKGYHAIKVTENIKWDELVIKLIREDS